jgi:hypothetical protein
MLSYNIIKYFGKRKGIFNLSVYYSFQDLHNFRAPDIAQFQIEQSTRFLNAKLPFISMLQQIALALRIYEFTNRKFSIF